MSTLPPRKRTFIGIAFAGQHHNAATVGLGDKDMSWGFEVGRVYNRRSDIHSRFGGQQQGGIITPADHPLVVIITGEEGLQHGYSDRYRPDGAFEYFGEGQVGDMQLLRGNRAIAEHSQLGKSLLSFRKTDDGVRFEGEMVYEAHHVERAPDRTGTERNAIVFELRPLEAIAEIVEAEPPSSGVTLEDLRQRALTATNSPLQSSTQSVRNVYQRTFWREPREIAKDALCRRHSFVLMETPTLNRITCGGSVMEGPIILHT